MRRKEERHNRPAAGGSKGGRGGRKGRSGGEEGRGEGAEDEATPGAHGAVRRVKTREKEAPATPRARQHHGRAAAPSGQGGAGTTNQRGPHAQGGDLARPPTGPAGPGEPTPPRPHRAARVTAPPPRNPNGRTRTHSELATRGTARRGVHTPPRAPPLRASTPHEPNAPTASDPSHTARNHVRQRPHLPRDAKSGETTRGGCDTAQDPPTRRDVGTAPPEEGRLEEERGNGPRRAPAPAHAPRHRTTSPTGGTQGASTRAAPGREGQARSTL